VNKDLFELRIGEQLRNAEAPVPEGAWEAIQSAMTHSPTPPSTNGGSGTAGFGAGLGVGIVAGALILGTLATNSTLKNNDENNRIDSATVVEVQNENSVLNDVAAAKTAKYVDSETPVATTEEEGQSETTQEEVRISDEIEDSEIGGNDIALDEEIHNDQATATPARQEPASLASNDNVVSTSETALPQTSEVKTDETREKEQTDHTEEEAEITVKPEAQISANATSGYAPLTVQFFSEGYAEEIYWDFGSKGSANTAQTEVIFDEPGRYTVSLTAFSENGEPAYDQIEIEVKEGSDITLPNIFTPNGDGLNDTYTVGYAKNIDDFYLFITDENGKKLFETRDIRFEWGSNAIDFSEPNTRYFVTYMAMGVDGKKHVKAQMPLIIVKD